MFSVLLIMNLEMELLSHMVSPCLVFLRQAKLFYKVVQHLTFPPAVLAFQISIPVSPNSHQYLFSSCLIITVLLRDVKWHFIVLLICISLTSNTEHLLCTFWILTIFPRENYSHPQSILNWVVDLFIISL